MYLIKIKFSYLFILLFIVHLTSCIEKEIPTVPNNGEASIKSIDFDYYGSVFNTKISGNTITLERLLPYGAANIIIHGISLTENCSSNLKVGNTINLSNNETEIIVTNNSSKKTATYKVQLYE